MQNYEKKSVAPSQNPQKQPDVAALHNRAYNLI